MRVTSYIFLKIFEESPGLHFLVYTGAKVNVILTSQTERKCPQQNFSLQAVNNTAITT